MVRLSDNERNSAGEITVGELKRREQAVLDAKETTVRCAFCDWSFTGRADEGREAAAAHRAEAHADRTWIPPGQRRGAKAKPPAQAARDQAVRAELKRQQDALAAMDAGEPTPLPVRGDDEEHVDGLLEQLRDGVAGGVTVELPEEPPEHAKELLESIGADYVVKPPAALREREPHAKAAPAGAPASEPVSGEPAPSRSRNASDATADRGRTAAWTRDEILAAIRRWNAEHGTPPLSADWRKRKDGYPSTTTVANHFGSWAAGVEAAGFPRPVRGARPSAAEATTKWIRVKGTGLAYRAPAEAYVAAEEIEADGERVASDARFDGDEAKAEQAIDQSRELAEKIRAAVARARGPRRDPRRRRHPRVDRPHRAARRTRRTRRSRVPQDRGGRARARSARWSGVVRQMGALATAVAESHNAKLGDAATTHAAQVSCPSSCVFKDGGGCYAETGRQGKFVTDLLNEAARDATAVDVAFAEADAIDDLDIIPGRPLRLHTVGDCASDMTALIVASAAERYMARGGGPVWTYTHAWREVARESWGTVSVIASCETAADVDDARSRGYAPSIVVEHFTSDRLYSVGREHDPAAPVDEAALEPVLQAHPERRALARDPDEADHRLSVLPCPAQTRGRSCTSCRLCFDDTKLLDRGYAIAFELHGIPYAVRQARAALRRPDDPLRRIPTLVQVALLRSLHLRDHGVEPTAAHVAHVLDLDPSSAREWLRYIRGETRAPAVERRERERRAA